MTTIEKRCTPRKIEIERKPYYRSTNANKNALIQQFHSAHFVFSVAGIERRRKKQHKKNNTDTTIITTSTIELRPRCRNVGELRADRHTQKKRTPQTQDLKFIIYEFEYLPLTYISRIRHTQFCWCRSYCL